MTNAAPMPLDEYFDRLERFDWYFAFSDDPRVYHAGEDIGAELFSIAAQSPAHMTLYRSFCSFMFSGPSFGKPRAPKPIRPAKGA